MSIVLWSEAMRRKWRNHSFEFKARVALTDIQEDLIMVELVKKFDVHANQIFLEKEDVKQCTRCLRERCP